MCGIVALVRANPVISLPLCDAFEEMWWGLQLRGLDGSGVFQVNKDMTLRMEKSAYTPDYAKFEKGIGPILRTIDESPFTVGHCRGATKKPAKADEKWLKKNAHPFQHDHITLVHNGYFSYVGQEHNDKHEVDSESFTNAVADLGIDAALKKAYGAYALVFHDKRDNTLNIARNSDRPLYRVEHVWGHFYISEPDLAVWILKRNNCPAAQKIVEVPIKQLITYKPFSLEFTTRPIDEYVDRSEYSRRRKQRWYPYVVGNELEDDEDEENGNYLARRYPVSEEKSINTKLSLDEVMDKVCRFTWDDCLFYARQRCQPTGWTPKMADDFKEFLSKMSVSDEVKQLPPPKEENKIVGLPLLKEIIKDGIIQGLFHDSFRINRGTSVIFPVTEIHEHQSFCAVIGTPVNPVANGRVKFSGNFNIAAKDLKETKRQLEGEVITINKVKEKGKTIYLVQVGNIKFSGYLDMTKMVDGGTSPKENSEAMKKKTEAALLISKNLDGAPVSLADVVMCPGCKDLVHKKTIKPYTQHAYKDEEGKMTSTIEINVCPKCHSEAKENFNVYYKMKYLPSIKDINKGVQ